MKFVYPIETINFYLQDHEPGSGIPRGYFMDGHRMLQILTLNVFLIRDASTMTKIWERINQFMDEFPTLEELQDKVTLYRLNRTRA